MPPAQLPDPGDFDAWTLAEWIEASLLLDELPEISRTSLRERFTAGMEPDQAEIDSAMGEVRRRAAILSQRYPYRAEGTRVIRLDTVDSTVYDFLLLLSLQHAPYRLEKRFEEINPAFELLAREALVGHLGPGARGVRFAWPARDDRPQQFSKAVPWLAKLMGLELGSLSDVDDVDNDAGLDVAAWRPFGDGQPGHLAVLAQCTVQVAFETKAKDLEPNDWNGWMRFGRVPMTALVIPFVVAVDAKLWMRLAGRVDLMLDRMRLLELLDMEALVAYPEYEAMKSFIVAERDAMRQSLTAEFGDGGMNRRPKIASRRKPVRTSAGSGRAGEAEIEALDIPPSTDVGSGLDSA
jgi:hypothetical protein